MTGNENVEEVEDFEHDVARKRKQKHGIVSQCCEATMTPLAPDTKVRKYDLICDECEEVTEPKTEKEANND